MAKKKTQGKVTKVLDMSSLAAINEIDKQASVDLGWTRAEEHLQLLLMISAGLVPLDLPEVALILRGVCGLVAFETELRIARRN